MVVNYCTIWTIYILCACFVASSNGEIYSSMAEMEDLLADVRETIKEDLTFLKAQPKKEKTRMQKNIKRMEAFSDIILHPDFTVLHPISAYRFLQNMSSVYDAVVQSVLLSDVSEAFIRKKIFSKLTSVEEDIDSIRMAILRIKKTYDLKASDILAGNINGHVSNQHIKDCFWFVAATRINNMTSNLSDEWLNACVNAVGKGSTSIVSIKYCKETAAEFEQNEMFREAAKIYEKLIKTDPDQGHYREKLKHLQDIISNKAVMPLFNKKHPMVEVQDHLCQGVDLKTPAERQSKQLVCRLVHDNPLLKLQPGRAELRSRDPHIVIYHNFLSKAEMDTIKNIAKRRMKRATVNYRQGSGKLSSPLRTCKNAYVDMTTPPFTVSWKLEALTGLKTGFFLNEDIQIANYGVGGHYFIHSDFYGPERAHLDERLATFMFYLSDVESGGATVFLAPKETVFPEEGAAVFWYNTYQNGTVNRNTQHAACPVAVGNKWIGTYWIHMNKQEFTKPCNLKKDYRYWPL